MYIYVHICTAEYLDVHICAHMYIYEHIPRASMHIYIYIFDCDSANPDHKKYEPRQAHTQSKFTKLLKDEAWECGTCHEKKLWKGYFRTTVVDGQDPGWQKQYSKFILQRGCLRKCIQCRQLGCETVDEDNAGNETLHQCQVRKKDFPRAEYAPSMWHNKSNANLRTVCLTCCNPPCSASDCPTCTLC